MPLIDLVGQSFNRLKVISFVETVDRKSYWQCKCSCDKKSLLVVRGDSLKAGTTKSCGCLKIESARTGNSRRIHGASKSVFEEGNSRLDYTVWKGIRRRCYSKKDKNYKYYGARGIKVYSEWRKSFIEFAKYIRTLDNCPSDKVLCSRLKGKRLKLSIDRIDNNKGYRPGNIKWSTMKEQNNNSRKNVIVCYKGKEMTLSQAVDNYAVVSYKIVSQRINRDNWDLHKALTTK